MYFLVATAFFSIPIAYLIGSLAAGLTGASVAVVSSWLRRPPHLYVFAATFGGLATVLTRPGGHNLDGPLDQSALLLTGAVAAIVCTRVARPFRLVDTAPPEALRVTTAP
jgi:hypothetical protein